MRDFYGFQADLLRNVLIDGEALVLLSPTGRGAVPLELKLLGPEYLDRSRVIVGKILDGIEYDAAGRRVAYWLYPHHPGRASRISRACAFPPRTCCTSSSRPRRACRGASAWFDASADRAA